MSANDASPDTPSNVSKDSATCPGQDAREGAQETDTDAQQNNPPTPKGPTNGINAFLWWVGKTGRIDEIDELAADLPEHYKTWKRLKNTEQDDLEGWE